MLRVAPCSHDAATYAVTRWHYSARMPRFKLVKYGVWEHDAFVGAVIYGSGASPNLVTRFGLDATEGCELVRVAMRDHATPVTQVVAESLRQLKATNPGMRLVISFADTAHGHVGTIYQAGNWLYLGADTHHEYVVNGTRTHPKTLHSRYGIGGQSLRWLREHVDSDAARVPTPPKHRYAYPLDKQIRRRVRRDTLPYPRGRSLDGETAPVPG